MLFCRDNRFIKYLLSTAVMMICYSLAGGTSPLLRKYPPKATGLSDLSFTQAVNTPVNTVYIPFELIGRLMIVQARVENIEGNFIVDTGSEKLVLNEEYFTSTSSSTVTALGNTGIVQVKEKHVDSLRLDPLRIPDINAHLADLNHIELKKNTRIVGLLGYDVFKNFELFIDFPQSRIVLNRIDNKGCLVDNTSTWEKPYDSLSFTLKKHLIIVNATVNSIPLEMILDSGAELNLIDRRVNKKVLQEFSIIKRVNLVGVGRKTVEVVAGVLNNVDCGRQSSKSMNTLLTSLQEINTSFGVDVEGVLGYEFLSKRRTLINYKKQKLYFFGPMRS